MKNVRQLVDNALSIEPESSTSFEEIGRNLEEAFQTIPLYDLKSRREFFAEIYQRYRDLGN